MAKSSHDAYHEPVMIHHDDANDEEVKRLEQEREEEELRDVWVSCPIISVEEPTPKRVCTLHFFFLFLFW